MILTLDLEKSGRPGKNYGKILRNMKTLQLFILRERKEWLKKTGPVNKRQGEIELRQRQGRGKRKWTKYLIRNKFKYISKNNTCTG